MRKILLLAFLVVIFIPSMTCMKGKKDEGVTFWHAMAGPLGKVLTEIIDSFNFSHQGSPIKPVLVGNYSTLAQKLVGAVAVNRPPVLSQVFGSWAAEFMEADKIVPIQFYIDNGVIPKATIDDMLDAFAKENAWDGRFVMFPFNKSVMVLYYNKDMLEKHGFTHPPRTWDEFWDYARELTVDEDGDGKPEVYGTAMNISVWLFTVLLYHNGGRLFDDHGNPVFNSPEGVAALEYLVNLVDSGYCYIASGYSHQDDFASQRVAMIMASSVSYSFMKNKITDFELGVAPLPHGKDSLMVISGTNVVLFKAVSEEKRRRAAEFVAYFTSPEIQARWAAHTGYVPITHKGFNDPYLKENLFSKVPGIEAAMRQAEYAVSEPNSSTWFVGRRILEEEGLEPAFRHILEPKEALDKAAKLIEIEAKLRQSK